QGGQAARAGRVERQARRRGARGADDRGAGRGRLRPHRLVHALCAGRHAGARAREAARGACAGPGQPRAEGEARRAGAGGSRAGGRCARGLRAQRDREMVRAGAALGRAGGLSSSQQTNDRRQAMTLSRRRTLSALGAAAGAMALPAWAQAPSGQPIRVGSTLALTGPLSATALTHKLVGEIYVEQLNKRGGLLGRPVQWIVKDDQSKPDLARTLYEQLVTSDKVDLLMGPYATGAILSAMGVAQRYNKVLVHHTFGIPSMAKYDKIGRAHV